MRKKNAGMRIIIKDGILIPVGNGNRPRPSDGKGNQSILGVKIKKVK